MPHSLDLLFHEPSKGKLPGPGIAQIVVNSRSIDDKGNIIITPNCVSLRDVEKQIDRLNEELEIIRRKAKQKFTKDK